MLRLRPATIADLALLRHWDEQPHAVSADDDWGWEVELQRSPDWREQLIAELDGRPIGFVQIMDPAREETRYWGDAPAGLRAIDIWIGEADDRGQGHGTEMMELALARCFSDPSVTAVLLDPLASNTRAHRFYERLGFRFVERRRFGADDCFVYRLERGDLSRSTRAPDVPAALGRVVVLVHDYEESLAFYRAALGAEPIFDQTTAEGQRLLHIGLPAQPAANPDAAGPTVGLWLLQATGDDRDLVGRQAGAQPFLVVYTPDCAASLERFTGAGGELRRPIREEAGARFAHVADLYGNEIVLVQLPA